MSECSFKSRIVRSFIRDQSELWKTKILVYRLHLHCTIAVLLGPFFEYLYKVSCHVPPNLCVNMLQDRLMNVLTVVGKNSCHVIQVGSLWNTLSITKLIIAFAYSWQLIQFTMHSARMSHFIWSILSSAMIFRRSNKDHLLFLPYF